MQPTRSPSLQRSQRAAGWRLLPQIMKAELVLDLGCGNGNLAKLLQSEGFIGSYFGIDENTYFLES